MSSPAVLDFAKYLAEIPPRALPAGTDPSAPAPTPLPTGINLRVDRKPPSLYDDIKGAVSTARAEEKNALTGGEDGSRPFWTKVREASTKALTEKSKDLEILTYFIEALVRLEGFPGLRDGFRLARELIEKYWDQLYPMPLPEEEGEDVVSVRVNSLAQLLRAEGRAALTIPLSRLPLMEAPSPNGPLGLDQYQKAVKLSQVEDARSKQRQIDAGATTLEMFQQAVAESSAPFFATLAADLTSSLDELTKLGKALDQRCKAEAPSISNLRDQLTACLDVLKDVAQSKLPVETVVDDKDKDKDKKDKDDKGARPPGAESLDTIRDRGHAFQVLGKVAAFFKRTEPHSVVSYALDQVVRWGNMPLPDLLSELIPDKAPRENLFQRVGIKMAEPAKGESKK